MPPVDLPPSNDSLPNYLRIAYHDYRNGPGMDRGLMSSSTGWVHQEADYEQMRGNIDGEGVTPSPTQEAVTNQHSLSQQRIARRVMHDLAAHGACILSAASGPARLVQLSLHLKVLKNKDKLHPIIIDLI